MGPVSIFSALLLNIGGYDFGFLAWFGVSIWVRGSGAMLGILGIYLGMGIRS